VIEITLRIDQRAADEVLLDLLGVDRDSGRWAAASARMAGSWTTWGQSAIDGDPATSWRSPFGQATGHRLTVDHGAPAIDRFVVQQPTSQRSLITAIRLTAGDRTLDVPVPPPDDQGRSPIELPETLSGAQLDLEVIAVEESTTIDRRYGEITVLPSAITEIEIPASAEPVTIPETMAAECRTDLLTIDGQGIGVSFSVPTVDALAGDPIAAEVCGPIPATDSDTELASTPGRETGLDVDRVVILAGEPGPRAVRPAARVTSESQLSRTVQVDGCQDGCWLVLGEGYNEAWSARADGDDLGPPQLVDGGFNGWRLPAGAESRLVDLRWTAQGPLNWAFAVSLLTVALALALVAWGLRQRRRAAGPIHAVVTVEPFPLASTRQVVVFAVTWIVASALLVDWIWGLVAFGASLLLIWNRRPAAVAVAGWAGMVGVGVAMVILNRLRRPFPNGGWPGEFAELHEISLFALVTMVIGAILGARRGGGRSPTITRP
jgi:arabinofuranan 3-O-arabinosyltransferase